MIFLDPRNCSTGGCNRAWVRFVLLLWFEFDQILIVNYNLVGPALELDQTGRSGQESGITNGNSLTSGSRSVLYVTCLGFSQFGTYFPKSNSDDNQIVNLLKIINIDKTGYRLSNSVFYSLVSWWLGNDWLGQPPIFFGANSWIHSVRCIVFRNLRWETEFSEGKTLSPRDYVRLSSLTRLLSWNLDLVE